MIPKIIHYCWFGPKEIPELERKCIKTWSEFLPDYEIMFWNEENFDVNSVKYVKEAYENKKYAFVSDYVRMHALYTYGGVYFDTDVEVIKDITPFLNDEAFIGFENRTMVAMGVIGASKGLGLIGEMLDYYNNNSFIDENGHADTTTICQIMVNILSKKGFEMKNSEQIIENTHIYERDVFYPKMMDDGSFRVTDDSVTIHHYSASWLTEREIRRGKSKIWRNFFRPVLRKVRIVFQKVLGDKNTKSIELFFRTKMR